MMFWYIGGILAGFAIGYVIAIAQRRDRATYKKGVNDCRNCKNMICIGWSGNVKCKCFNLELADKPKACSNYNRIEGVENEE